MKLTLKEYGALDLLLSQVSLSELIEAAQRGFELESTNADTSNETELSLLCTSILAAIE